LSVPPVRSLAVATEQKVEPARSTPEARPGCLDRGHEHLVVAALLLFELRSRLVAHDDETRVERLDLWVEDRGGAIGDCSGLEPLVHLLVRQILLERPVAGPEWTHAPPSGPVIGGSQTEEVALLTAGTGLVVDVRVWRVVAVLAVAGVRTIWFREDAQNGSGHGLSPFSCEFALSRGRTLRQSGEGTL
jgi:hypothetical protein